jgi:sortase (surface protein transpeptidase)
MARRAIISGGAGLAVAVGAGATYLVTRPAMKATGATVGPPIKGVVTFTGKGKVKSIDHIDLPLTLAVPTVGIDAPVVAVGLTKDGAMDVPKRPSDVGWFEYSPRPGLAGNSILAGHLDWQGSPGAFVKLASVKTGEAVIVRESDGGERMFAVEWKREVAAEAPPPKQVFEPIISPGLTLITCGGRYNAETRRYDTRIVVRAIRK